MRTFFIYLPNILATNLSEEKKDIIEVLYQNRKLVLAVLAVPVFGMAIASAIILWKQPDNLITVMAVIFFVAVQYVLMMFFWSKRVEILAKKEEEKKHEEKSPSDSSVEAFIKGGDVLLPEEERVFPSKKESESTK